MTTELSSSASPPSSTPAVPKRGPFIGGNTPLALLAVIMAMIAQAQLSSGRIRDSLLLYFVAGVLWWFALPGETQAQAEQESQVAPTPAIGRWSWRLWIAIAAAGLPGAWAIRLLNVDQPSRAFWLFYLASLVILPVAALWLDQRRERSDTSSDGENTAVPSQRTVWISLGLIFVLAAVLRLVNLDSLPFGVWYDEAENGLQAQRILREPGYLPLFVEDIHAPAHYLYLVAAALARLGDNVQAIRVVSAIMGIVSVGAAYLLGRELHGRVMGLLLALLIAFARWHVNFSRIGMYNISTPLFELLAMAFLLAGLRRGRYTDYALSGLAVGLGLSFYSVFQLFIVVMAHYLFSTAVLGGVMRFLRHTWAGLLIFLLAILLVIMPVATYAQSHPDIYFKRARQTSLYRAKDPATWLPALGENLRKHLWMFHYQGDRNGRHNLSGEPMLDPYSGPLMLLGLLLCLRRAHRPRWLLPPIWLLVMLMGGVLSLDFEAPQSLRAIGSLPAAYLLAAIALDTLRQMWQHEAGSRSAAWYWVPALLLLALTGYSNIHTYFVRQANSFRSWVEFATPETIVAQRLAALDDNMQPYIISYYDNHPTLRFVAPNTPAYKVFDTTGYLPIVQPADKGMFLALDTGLFHVFRQLQALYPNATFEDITPPFGGSPVLHLAYLSPDDVASLQGVTGRYFANERWQGIPTIQKESELDLHWPQDAPLDLPFSAEWEGVLRVQSYGIYTFTVEAPAQAELWIDEFPILQGQGILTAMRPLAEGNHALRVRAIGAQGDFRLRWQPPNAPDEIIPSWLLYVPPVTSNGLQGAYYANDGWRGEPAFLRIDPQLDLYFHVTPLPRPYTVEWTGKIAAPVGGEYLFGVKSTDEAVLWIDEQEVLYNAGNATRSEGKILLDAGLHDIRIRYGDRTNRTHIRLDWTPPDGNAEFVPAHVLFPPRGSYADIPHPAAE